MPEAHALALRLPGAQHPARHPALRAAPRRHRAPAGLQAVAPHLPPCCLVRWGCRCSAAPLRLPRLQRPPVLLAALTRRAHARQAPSLQAAQRCRPAAAQRRCHPPGHPSCGAGQRRLTELPDFRVPALPVLLQLVASPEQRGQLRSRCRDQPSPQQSCCSCWRACCLRRRRAGAQAQPRPPAAPA